jgi:hypothetical protein
MKINFIDQKRIKETWVNMPWWAKTIDIIAVGCMIFTATTLTVKVVKALNR